MSSLSGLWGRRKPAPLLERSARSLSSWLPAALLLVGGLRAPGGPSLLLCGGAVLQLAMAGCFAILRRQRRGLAPEASLILLYVLALVWLWLTVARFGDWFFHLSQALLLFVPLLVFARQILASSGITELRRARMLARRLAERHDLPANLAACRSLPEVKALREALHMDATPALGLLKHRRPEVRVAALAALEFRQNWRVGQADLVLKVAQEAPEPMVRAAAVMALGNQEEQVLIEALAEFLRDPAADVRRAASEALLWDTEHRWGWIRHAVRRTLSDPALQDDDTWRHDGQLLTPAAVDDLTAWAAEKGLVGMRSALMLGVHYARALSESPDESLIQDLRRQLANSHTPPALRLELARLLRDEGDLDQELVEQLVDPVNPAPLRLLGVETLLAIDPAHPEAQAALRDLAHLPNREIALATAELVQRRLGIDFGLAPGQPPPPVHSRQAAEVTRRVMRWAVQQAAGLSDRPPGNLPERQPVAHDQQTGSLAAHDPSSV